MATARLTTNTNIDRWFSTRVTDHDNPEYPHYLSTGGFGLFMDDEALNSLALALIQRMYDKGTNASRDMLDTLAHLTHVMADTSGYEAAAADTLYDQYLDDAITGV